MDSKNHIVLIGLPGVGKTSTGKSLSKMLDGIHVDIDQEIQKDQEISISDMINQKGEDAFRSLEEDKLKVILDSPSPLIVSSGGGVVLSEKNRKLIKEKSFSIYITCGISEIVKRLDVLNRPLLYNTNKNSQLEAMLRERESFYREASHVMIDITGLSIRDASKEIYRKVKHVRV